MTLEPNRLAPTLVTAALALFAATAYADPPAAHYCEVTMEFSIDGKRIAEPSAIVAFGEPAEVTIGNPDQHAWRIRILAAEPTIVRRANVIPVSLDLHEIAKGQSFARASPEVKAVPGQRVDFETIFGGGDGRKAHVSLVANVKSDADIDAMKRGSDVAE